MTGLVAQKPYGVDAAGRYIEMNYKLERYVLTLEYNRNLKIYNDVLTKQIKNNMLWLMMIQIKII